MAVESSSSAPRYLSALLNSGSLTGLSDAELLERFATRIDSSDEIAELAFATLLARHGAMVMRVCRAVLADQDDADDAFQATFLVLASRSKSIRRGDSLAAWLHGVALRVSACARSRAARRQRHERRFAEMTTHTKDRGTECDSLSSELDSALHNEIGRLPKRFRTAVVLCYLEGQTHEMAAKQLGCPVGTIKSRLAAAREKLRRRLTRRGLAPTAIPATLSGSASVSVSESSAGGASIPAALVEATVRGALRISSRRTALTGIASSEALVLMQEVLKMTATARVILVTTTILMSGMFATGAGMAAYHAIGHNDGNGPDQSGGVDPAQTTSQNGKLPGTPDQAKPQQTAVPASKAELNKAAMARDAEDRVKSLIGEYTAKEEEFRKTAQSAKTVEERKALRQSRPMPAFYAGGLLHIAEGFPGTPAAEEGLIWIVTHLQYGTIPERAREMLARDHAGSDKLEPVFNNLQVRMAGSIPTERLFRAVLARNENRKIKGCACFYLARYLDYQASFVRLESLLEPSQLKNMPPMNNGWGDDYQDRLRKMDPSAARAARQLRCMSG